MYFNKRNTTLQASESQEEAVDTILTVTDRLFSSVGDAHEMVKQARQLAQVDRGLVFMSLMHLSLFCPPRGVTGIHGALDRRPLLTGGNLTNLWNPGSG